MVEGRGVGTCISALPVRVEGNVGVLHGAGHALLPSIGHCRGRTLFHTVLLIHAQIIFAHALLDIWIGGRNGILVRAATSQTAFPTRSDEGRTYAHFLI